MGKGNRTKNQPNPKTGNPPKEIKTRRHRFSKNAKITNELRYQLIDMIHRTKSIKLSAKNNNLVCYENRALKGFMNAKTTHALNR